MMTQIQRLGLAGALFAAAPIVVSSVNAHPSHRQEFVCKDKDEYRVHDARSTERIVGTGLVCDDSVRYYGELTSTQGFKTLPEVLEYESGGTDTSQAYRADLIVKDSVVKGTPLEMRIGPDSASTSFPHTWRGFLGIPIEVKVNVSIHRIDDKWMMEATARKMGRTWYTLKCDVTNLQYECKKKAK